MGAGILPVALYKGEVYFLFGRESRHIDHKASGLWSDFGGSREKNETYKQTAIREGYEESSGFLGTKKQIENLACLNLQKLLAVLQKQLQQFLSQYNL